jgi:predicted small lipoprotein YifL
VLLAVLLLSTACGFRGPLYLPGETPEQAAQREADNGVEPDTPEDEFERREEQAEEEEQEEDES